MIYLDNAASTRIYPEVLEEMMPYLTSEYGNPGGMYTPGRKAREAVENARSQVAKLFGCSPEEVIFTSGGSEGNNMVLRGAAEWMRNSGKTEIITTSMEHDSVLRTVKELERLNGFHASFADPNPDEQGAVNPQDISNLITGKTGIISVMHVNNETGVINDIRSVADMISGFAGSGSRTRPVLHSDCVQSAGNYDINVDRLGVDLATVSSHKIHGPKGVGAVYCRNNTEGFRLSPLITGGLMQEHGLRGGTENVPGIVGFGKACEIASSNLEKIRKTYTLLSEKFLHALWYSLGYDSVEINGASMMDGKTVNLWIKGVDAQSLILMLSDRVCLSAGSACASHSSEPSHVLRAMGFPDDRCGESVRVSFSDLNTEEEVEEAALLVASSATILRNGVPNDR